MLMVACEEYEMKKGAMNKENNVENKEKRREFEEQQENVKDKEKRREFKEQEKCREQEKT